jgi:glycosyltransferase involved in cell wall biosynthesis
MFANGIIVTGKGVYDYYIKNTFLESICCAEIHAPVNTNVFDPEKIQSLETMGKNKQNNIVTVSGISPVKGIEYFVEMASELIKTNNELIFYVSGAELSSQKKYSEKIKSIIKETSLNDKNYKYYGMIDDVPSFLAGANIFVCTSVTEAGPMTVWEAMSMGMAVITTDVGAVKQYIKDGISGFVVPVSNVKALADCVRKLVQNPQLTKKVGEHARIVAVNKLDVKIAAKKYFKFYEQVLFNN